jgi:hypothetical protein
MPNATCKAIRVDAKSIPENPGEYKIVEGAHNGIYSRRLVFACPCGCGSVAGIKLRPEPNGWDFNEDYDKPTCAPSILIIGGCAWHGYLTDGEFNGC